MTLAKRAAVAFALWFSLASGVIAQGVPVSGTIAGGRPCMAVNPTYPSSVTPKRVEDTVVLDVRISKSGVVHDMKPRFKTVAAKCIPEGNGAPPRFRFHLAVWRGTPDL